MKTDKKKGNQSLPESDISEDSYSDQTMSSSTSSTEETAWGCFIFIGIGIFFLLGILISVTVHNFGRSVIPHYQDVYFLVSISILLFIGIPIFILGMFIFNFFLE